jgi:hypothetical protein
VIISEDDGMDKKYYWKNGDKPLRAWWKENGKHIKEEGIAVIEWDTLVGKQFPEIPDNFDLVGKQMMIEDPSMRKKWRPLRQCDPEWQDKNWFWWQDGWHFKLSEHEHCVGLVSFGAFFMRKWILDAICDSKWDHIYSLSIQNELRLPTIAHLSGARIGEISLPGVNFHETPVGKSPEIYHSVKENVNVNIWEECL